MNNNGSANNNNASNANGVAPFGCFRETGMDSGVAHSETTPDLMIQGGVFRAWPDGLANSAAARPHTIACGRWQEHGLRAALLRAMADIDEITRPEVVLAAMRDCESGVRWKASTQRFEIDALRWAAGIRKDLLGGTYEAMSFRRFDITERGKLRHIQAVHIRDRTVQKLICRHALRPEIRPRLIYDNSASIEDKGTAFALARLKEHLRWHLARYGKAGVIVIMDYRGFFDSIPHDKAIAALCAHQSDPLLRRYIGAMIDAFDGSRGLGLGSEVSQIAAALYPTPVDRLAKEQLRLHCYARYNDDSYFICRDRPEALRCLEAITAKAAELGLEIHRAKTKIHNLASDDFTYLKKRVHITGTGRIVLRLTRANIRREEARIRLQRAEYDAGRMPLRTILQSYQCWRSYAQSYNAHEAVHRMDRYFTEIFGGVIQEERGGRVRYGHTEGGRR